MEASVSAPALTEAQAEWKSNFFVSLTLVIKAEGLGQLFTSWGAVLSLLFVSSPLGDSR